MTFYIMINNSNETLEVISNKTLKKYEIELKKEDIDFLNGEQYNTRVVEIFGWGELTSYNEKKVKEYREYYKAEGWDYVENICL